MAKVIMIQGTMSNAGKSLITAGLCRIFHQDGYRVAPFKSQNMALNSYITTEGLEMGRAQVMQAEAAGIEPQVCMNPILLKPTNDIGSQVIVNGTVIGNMPAREYFNYKKKLIPDILKAFHKLEEQADIIVIEGAGSPAEINLKENDIVNMGMAEMVNAPVLLAGDIDRGGVFAQLLGTLMLLEEQEKSRVKGLIINKFRGDVSILEPGIQMLEEKGGIPVCGVIPYMKVQLEDEDSLTGKFKHRKEALIDLAVVRYPRISNFTDFDVFEHMEGVSVRYVTSVQEIHHPDAIILPGSKNTMGDLKWMRENGMEAMIKKLSVDTPVIGICGGYQMLGESLEDPYSVEEGGSLRGMELLPLKTVMSREKVRRQVTGTIDSLTGMLASLSGKEYKGYEIHMGHTGGTQKTEQIQAPKQTQAQTQAHAHAQEESCIQDAVVVQKENVYGTYVHGIFDEGDIASTFIRVLAEKKGVHYEDNQGMNYQQYKESQYDLLADTLRKYLDMEAVYGMLQEAEYDKSRIG